MDMLLATGEQVTVALFSMALHAIGVKAVSLTGAQAGIVTDSAFRKARIQSIDTGRITKEFKKNDVVVVAGFQGVDEEQNISTLGRGGSNLSAVAVAASLQCECLENYTDVEGVFTADPRIVKNAKKINEISFDEMLELASSGTDVIQSRAIECAKKYNLPVWVRGTFSDNVGTLIKEEDEHMEQVLIRGVALSKKDAKVTLKSVPDRPGMAADIFGTIGEKNINVDVIVQNSSNNGTTDVSFTAPKEDLPAMMEAAKQLARKMGSGEVDINPSIAKVSIVGVGMRSHAGVAAKMFRLLAEKNINIDMISTSEIKITVVVHEKDAEKAVQALHDGFELGK
jgi:aspartate kinase